LRFVYEQDVRVAAFSGHEVDASEIKCAGDFLGYIGDDGVPVVEDGREVCTDTRFEIDKVSKEIKCVKAVPKCDEKHPVCEHSCHEEEHKDDECCKQELKYPHCWQPKPKPKWKPDYPAEHKPKDQIIAYDWAEW
jgi:hypothetical protein